MKHKKFEKKSPLVKIVSFDVYGREHKVAYLLKKDSSGEYTPVDSAGTNLPAPRGGDNSVAYMKYAQRYAERGVSLRTALHAAEIEWKASTEKKYWRELKDWSYAILHNISVYKYPADFHYLSGLVEYIGGRKLTFLIDTDKTDWISHTHPIWQAIDDTRWGAKLKLVNRLGGEFVYICDPSGNTPGQWEIALNDGMFQKFYGIDATALNKMAKHGYNGRLKKWYRRNDD